MMLEGGKLAITDNFMEPEPFEAASEFITKQCTYGLIKSSNWTGADYWHPSDGNVMKSSPWSTARGDLPPSIDYVVQSILGRRFFKPDLYSATVSAFAYPAGACFHWHDDGNAQWAFIYYVSKWELDWGGELLIQERNGLGTYIAPLCNRLVVISRGIRHKIAPVDFRAGANIRFSIAGFITERKK